MKFTLYAENGEAGYCKRLGVFATMEAAESWVEAEEQKETWPEGCDAVLVEGEHGDAAPDDARTWGLMDGWEEY